MNITDDTIQQEELKYVEGSYAPHEVIDNNLGGSAVLARETLAKPSAKTPEKPEAENVEGESKSDETLVGGFAEASAIARGTRDARAAAEIDGQIAEIRKELETLRKYPPQAGTEQDGETNIALLEERLAELEAQQQSRPKARKPKDKLDVLVKELGASMIQDLKVLASVPQAIRGARLQKKMDRQAVAVQKEINQFRSSKGLEPIEVGIRIKTAGKKQNIRVRESADDFQARLKQQVQEARGLGMGVSSTYERATEAFERFKEHTLKHPPMF